MPDQAAAAGVRVVPLTVRFGEQEWRAGVDMSTEEFWQRLLAPGESDSCRQADDCVARTAWATVGAKIETALDSISFEDLLRQSRGKDRERGPAAHRSRPAAAGRGVC